MSRAFHAPLAGLLTVLLAAPAAAFDHKESQGPATLEARSDRDGLVLGLADVLRIVVTLEGRKGLKVEEPVKPVAGAAWELLTTSTAGPKAGEDGRVRWRQSLTLAPIGPGELKVELTPLVFRDDAAPTQTIAWQPFTVKVQTTIKDVDLGHARDITATEELPPPTPGLNLPWPWLTLPPVVVLGLAGLWLLRRHQSRARPDSALQKAQRECDRVLQMKLPERDRGKVFVALLSGILRRYLEHRFDLPAQRQTTAELLHAIDARADLDDAAKRWLHGFFAQTDRVKFAGAAIDALVCHQLAAEVLGFCQATAPGPGSAR